jgi:uncharacterized protein (TIGR02265 family)
MAFTGSGEPVVFSPAIEGAVRACGDRITPALRAKAKTIGIDLDATMVAYPVDTFLPVFLMLSEALVPGDEASRPQRLRSFGQQITEAYAHTAIGTATFAMARVIGVRRSLQRAGRNIRNTGNYMDADGLVIDDTEVHLVTRVLPEFLRFVKPEWRLMEHYRLGIIDSFLKQLKAKDSVAEVISRDEATFQTTYRVTWRD